MLHNRRGIEDLHESTKGARVDEAKNPAYRVVVRQASA